MGKKETSTQIVTTLGSSDYVRATKDGISSRISKSNLATAIATELSGDQSIRSSSSNTAMTAGDGVILMDTSGGDRSVTLGNPADFYDSANGVTKKVDIVQKIDGGNTLTLNKYASENLYINGASAASIAITGGSSATLVTDGTDWSVVG